MVAAMEMVAAEKGKRVDLRVGVAQKGVVGDSVGWVVALVAREISAVHDCTNGNRKH